VIISTFKQFKKTKLEKSTTNQYRRNPFKKTNFFYVKSFLQQLVCLKKLKKSGVISPLLANLFLHYSLDKWLELKHKTVNFERYADDAILHCKSKAHAEWLLE